MKILPSYFTQVHFIVKIFKQCRTQGKMWKSPFIPHHPYPDLTSVSIMRQSLHTLPFLHTHTHTHTHTHCIYGYRFIFILTHINEVLWLYVSLSSLTFFCTEMFWWADLCTSVHTDLPHSFQPAAQCPVLVRKHHLLSSFPCHGQLIYFSVSLLCKTLWHIAFYLPRCAHVTMFSHIDPRNDWIVCRKGMPV